MGRSSGSYSSIGTIHHPPPLPGRQQCVGRVRGGAHGDSRGPAEKGALERGVHGVQHRVARVGADCHEGGPPQRHLQRCRGWLGGAGWAAGEVAFAQLLRCSAAMI